MRRASAGAGCCSIPRGTYQSPEFVKAFIDAMALHKLNVLQWHLTDDQGWRLEIKRYPRLTKIGAWRVPEGAAAAHDIDPRTHKPRLYGGYYSQAQVRAIVRYAAERHITIVPEIEMPGHATAAIVAYPKLGSTRTSAEGGAECMGRLLQSLRCGRFHLPLPRQCADGSDGAVSRANISMSAATRRSRISGRPRTGSRRR